MKDGKFNTLVDSAWGSSGKGAVSSRLAEIFGIKNVSATNMSNAGHSCVLNGETFVGKILPTPFFLKKHGKGHKQLTAWIGPTSAFELKQLEAELGQTLGTVGKDIFIHNRAAIVTDLHKAAEGPGGSLSTEHISSTMSGAGAAIAQKAMRLPDVRLARGEDFPTLEPLDFYAEVWKELELGNTFLHEVSQGWALSINSGTHYPFCTSRECTPQQAFADMGIRPSQAGDVYLNIRANPIRVGNNYSGGVQVGYSGDCLDDHEETSWQRIGEEAEMPQDQIDSLSTKEKTTVTKKLRRVFTPSWALLQQSAEFCGATKLVLNFPQYIHWSAHGIRGGRAEFATLHAKVRAYVDKMEDVTNLKVCMLGTGADHNDFIWLD